MKKIINKTKALGRLLKSLNNFLYHFLRYFRYSAWIDHENDPVKREYHVVKIYHSLEKSMSYKIRKVGSGWKDAFELLTLLEIANKKNNALYGEMTAKGVLKSFLLIDGNLKSDNAAKISRRINSLSYPSVDDVGVKLLSLKDFEKGTLRSPEDFFHSRYSLREFSPNIISDEVIRRVISLALKTPSVCNRQPWHVYATHDDEVIRTALALQNGNRGFGHNVPNLAIVCADLRAFMASAEPYQHWIDGGLFSMSIVYALHSMGIASCCLNWSVNPSEDKKLRKVLNLNPNHSVIMMIAFGLPNENNKVCVSSRRSIDEVLTYL